MKNKVSDVRNHLVAVMEALNDPSSKPEEQAAALERAKAMSSLAQQYVSAVKVGLDAVRLFDETQLLPSSVEAPKRKGAQVLTFEQRKTA